MISPVQIFGMSDELFKISEAGMTKEALTLGQKAVSGLMRGLTHNPAAYSKAIGAVGGGLAGAGLGAASAGEGHRLRGALIGGAGGAALGGAAGHVTDLAGVIRKGVAQGKLGQGVEGYTRKALSTAHMERIQPGAARDLIRGAPAKPISVPGAVSQAGTAVGAPSSASLRAAGAPSGIRTGAATPGALAQAPAGAAQTVTAIPRTHVPGAIGRVPSGTAPPLTGGLGFAPTMAGMSAVTR